MPTRNLRHPFEERILSIRRSTKPVPFDWYRFDSFANVTQIEALLPKGLDSLLESAAGEPVADIGAGDGDMSFLLESLGCAVTAMDWPGTNANQMKGIALIHGELNSSVAIREVQVDEQFALDGDRFGLTLAFGLLYHLKNPYYFVEKLSFHTRNVLLSTRILPRGKTKDAIAYLATEREYENDVTNFWFLSEAALLRLLDRAGWNVITHRIVGDGKDDRMFVFAESRVAQTQPTIRLLNGWHRMEHHAWRWTSREFGAVIENRAGSTRFDLHFTITPPLLKSGDSLTVEATVSGVKLPAETYQTPGPHTYSRPIAPATQKTEIQIRLSRTFTEPGEGGRELGVIVLLPRETVIGEDCGLQLA